MALTHLSFWRRLAPVVVLSALLATLAPAQKIFAWGDNGVGQLNVPAAAQSGATKVVAGYYFSLALKDGGVLAWGDNSYGECNVPVAAQSGVTTMVGGVLHSLALKNGGVIAWGSNERGESNVPAAAGSGVTAVAAGEYTSLALKDGGVIGWGNNDYGVLTIPAVAQSGVTAIASGSYHALGLKNGGVVGWGMNVAGDLDIPDAAKSGVTAIAAGYLHSLALKSDGSVVAWGWNSQGQTDVPLAAQSGVVSITAGYDFSMALKSDGSVVAWGDNDYGWLNVPAAAQPIVAISASAYHTLALQAAAWATLDQAEVYGTYAATGTVHLGTAAGVGGATVDIASDNALVHVPATVHVAEGATTATFPVTTDAVVGSDVNVKVRASLNGSATVDAKLTVKGVGVAVAFNHPSVIGGSTTSLRTSVSLAFALPFDVTFSLGSSDSDVLSVPASITIPAGQTTVSVPVTHNYACGCAPETVTASFQGVPVATGNISVEPVRATVTLESTSILSGYYTFGFVTLNTTLRAPLDVYTCGCDPDLYMPDVVRINAKARTAFFPIISNPVARSYTTYVAVLVNGNFFYTPLKVLAAPSVRSIAAPSGMYGNGKITVTVQLNKAAGPDGQDVYLSSSDDALTVPDYVTVPEGATTASFEAFSSDVSAILPVVLTAETDVSILTRPLTIRPLVPTSVTLSSTSVVGGGSVTGTVTLKAAVAVDTEVPLSSSNPLVTVPASVIVPAGSKSATFTVQTSRPTKATGVKVIATLNGTAASVTLKVTL